ncbi:MAG TPA: tRNA uridine-5-carboxymethylaminomethyl(34) synthesis GTPase MnmE [Turneriella sp.]|nr:tRNA uridine-5-carboxymethylaminomethyl(34) synthesis GTPase MnmE [Turneriella sp.]HNN01471.1 tRNA uridine-5-carboxymethylaminomethyl(34) synthesis GTPase MnmE [Turneriella sp.]
MSSRATISTDNPICAPATAAGARSAIAVIRASGSPGSGRNIFDRLGNSFTTKTNKVAAQLSAREAHYGILVDGNERIDDVIFTRFDGRASFTGEDSFEISCHGNPLIIRRILALLYSRGFRAAEPGEFTRRAYLNGKLDLDAAQAVAEIIEARSAVSLKAAQRLAQGSFRRDMLQLRSQLMNLLADLNAELDFIDEDISFATRETKLRILHETAEKALYLETEAARFETMKNGFHIAIVGAPNAGKSSLMNRFIGHDRSIVSDIAGTTRDYIEAEMEIAGVNIRLFDTAGLRDETGDAIEQIGMERTLELMNRAHICILLVDGSEAAGTDSFSAVLASEATRLTVVNKADVLHPSWQNTAAERSTLFISARTGQGIDELLSAIGGIIEEKTPPDALPLSIWQRRLLNEIAGLAKSAAAAVNENEMPEVITHTVNQAVDRIAELTGEITSEDILGRIFSRFCIGK